MFGPIQHLHIKCMLLSCWLCLSSLDQSSSEQVVDIIASRNFAAVQTASGKVGWEGREGGREGRRKGRRKGRKGGKEGREGGREGRKGREEGKEGREGREGGRMDGRTRERGRVYKR